jgi:hypothetical protein
MTALKMTDIGAMTRGTKAVFSHDPASASSYDGTLSPRTASSAHDPTARHRTRAPRQVLTTPAALLHSTSDEMPHFALAAEQDPLHVPLEKHTVKRTRAIDNRSAGD